MVRSFIRRRFSRHALALALCGLVLGFYAWTIGSSTMALFPVPGGRQTDYYNLLTDGFLKGHLYLDVVPDPKLVSAEDPYNPAKRPPGSALHDAALYHGRYYLYFGPAPVVTLFLPWRWLTGRDLPGPAAVLLATAVGFLCSVAVWGEIRRRFFPASGWAAPLCVIPVLGWAAMTHAVLRRPSFWEMPIAAGYAFAMAALWCLVRVGCSRRPALLMGAAGLLLGLASGSRPTYAVGSAALALPLWALWREGRRLGRWRSWPTWAWWRCALAGAAGLGAIGLALLWYNYARFGRPFEFGFHYQLTDGYEANLRHFDLGFIGPNLHLYYFAVPQWGRYFPFVHEIQRYHATGGYYGSESVAGLLPTVPFVFLAAAAPLALRRRAAAERDGLIGALGAVAALYLSVGAFALIFFSAVIRYMVDFTPALMILAGGGFLALERALHGRSRRAFLAASGVLAALSVAFGVLANLELYDSLQVSNPGLYRKLARLADLPVRAWEKVAGTYHGPIEVTVRFPRDKGAKLEPLVTTGWAQRSDYLFIYYSPDHAHIQLGFDHTGHGIDWTKALPVDLAQAHTFKIEMGSFYPPDRAGPPGGAVVAGEYYPRRRLRVALDGDVVLDHPQEFFNSAPGALRIGASGTGEYGGTFTGQVLAVRGTEWR